MTNHIESCDKDPSDHMTLSRSSPELDHSLTRLLQAHCREAGAALRPGAPACRELFLPLPPPSLVFFWPVLLFVPFFLLPSPNRASSTSSSTLLSPSPSILFRVSLFAFHDLFNFSIFDFSTIRHLQLSTNRVHASLSSSPTASTFVTTCRPPFSS